MISSRHAFGIRYLFLSHFCVWCTISSYDSFKICREECHRDVTVCDLAVYNQASGVCTKVHKDECASNPCHNNSTCIDQRDAYTCICAEDITGETCDTWLFPCLSNPCQNNGICSSINTTYNCECADENRGERCQNCMSPMTGGGYDGDFFIEEPGYRVSGLDICSGDLISDLNFDVYFTNNSTQSHVGCHNSSQFHASVEFDLNEEVQSVEFYTSLPDTVTGIKIYTDRAYYGPYGSTDSLTYAFNGETLLGFYGLNLNLGVIFENCA